MLDENRIPASICCLAIELLQIEVSRYFFDHFRGYRLAVGDKGVDQGMLAKQVGNARNTAGMAVHCFNRLGTKKLFSGAPSDAQALLDVALSL